MAIYKPTFMKPNSVEIDAGNNNDFTCVIQGTIAVSYNLTIFKASDSSQVFTTNEVALGTPLYNGDTLTVNIPNTSGMVNGVGEDYKWRIEIFEVASTTSVISEEKRFFARTIPVVSITNFISSIVQRDYIFEGLYTQAQNVSLQYFRWDLYDSTGQNLIDTTGNIYNANIKYDYDRYLDNQSYQIELTVKNQNDTVTSTGKNTFDVEYTFPSVSFTILAENNPDDDSVRVDWNNAVQIPGESSGSFSFLIDTPFVGTNSIDIDSGLITYSEQNSNPLNINSNNTDFRHTSFGTNIYSNIENKLVGSGWEINGVLMTHDIEDSGNEYKKILAFELDSFLLYTQFNPGDAPILVEEYRVYGPQNLFTLQPSPVAIDAFYIWDDSDIWPDPYFWVDGEDISSVWWKLSWIHPNATTHELVWERSVDS